MRGALRDVRGGLLRRRSAFAADADARRAAAGRALFDLAGGEVPFWANMVKYARFSISIMVGFAFMFGRPVVNLLKKPQTAVLVIGGLVGGFKFFKWTIETMSGINDDMTGELLSVRVAIDHRGARVTV